MQREWWDANLKVKYIEFQFVGIRSPHVFPAGKELLVVGSTLQKPSVKELDEEPRLGSGNI